MKYENIISLGYFCSPASEIKRLNMRKASYPFDWLICEFEFIMALIENAANFEEILKEQNLYQFKDNLNVYCTERKEIIFFHEFTYMDRLKKQLPKVIEKYNRRFIRFYEDILNPTLFIRYIKDYEELKYIEKNYMHILGIVKKFNVNSQLIFVANNGIISKKLDIFNVEKDSGDCVAREFLEKNSELKEKILNSYIQGVISINTKVEVKQKMSTLEKLWRKFIRIFRPYIHYNRV
ncbi:MAG: DUF1796 family putative cysteine peptidase [Fusobacteria bacterium]|nr:DUF1796 family putative cysteine peptidase [Fusobacteriota bacterium]